jgi:hypothetical protein
MKAGRFDALAALGCRNASDHHLRVHRNRGQYLHITQQVLLMLTALLETPLGNTHVKIGPQHHFVAEGEMLKTPNGDHIAAHRGGTWQAGDVAYIAISFDKPVNLTFDDPAVGAHADPQLVQQRAIAFSLGLSAADRLLPGRSSGAA